MIDQIDFHDGYVDGLLISGPSIRIFLRTVDEKRFTLILSQVETLRAEDFRQGNIIFELNLLSVDELDSAFIFEAYDYSEELKRAFIMNTWVEGAKKKGLQAIEITPSYGCSIAALFKGYTLVAGTLPA